ncbi:MAG: zinc ribbon domain-containing protein [Desulfobulbaceae bacterium]|nr:MAG: zinc ribbon domain-containing protein [Desulfobulbaceae bacterium]
MPIYEFFCDRCNVIFNFFSRRIDTTTIPSCPRCGKEKLAKQMSAFATISRGGTESEDPLDGIDESRMEKAFARLMKEAEGMNEDDPRQMASLMRRFSQETGVDLGGNMEEALSRMEAGEDPEEIERDMGDVLEDGDLSFESLKKKTAAGRRRPVHDETLYDLQPD